MKVKISENVKTPHGIAKVIRIEEVYGSHDDRITVIFPDGKVSQYSSDSLKEII